MKRWQLIRRDKLALFHINYIFIVQYYYISPQKTGVIDEKAHDKRKVHKWNWRHKSVLYWIIQ